MAEDGEIFEVLLLVVTLKRDGETAEIEKVFTPFTEGVFKATFTELAGSDVRVTKISVLASEDHTDFSEGLDKRLVGVVDNLADFIGNISII